VFYLLSLAVIHQEWWTCGSLELFCCKTERWNWVFTYAL